MKQIKSKMSSSNSSNKLKEEGNRLFMKRNYKEAIEMYSKAIEKCTNSTHFTNRALCYFKLMQWSLAIEDCRRAIELDPHSVKAYFFMGQSLCELFHFDEAIVHLKRAHELTKELKENYGDEITRTIRNVKRRRWVYLEEKKSKQETELQGYLKRLMLEDKQKQMNKLRSNGSEAAVGVVQNGESKVSEEGGAKSSGMAEVLAESKEKDLMNSIELEFEQRNAELDRLFAENESRRRNREVPDYLCGIIVYLLIIELGEDI